LLVPVEKVCSLLGNDRVVPDFFFSQFRNAKILDPLEHNHEEEQEAFQEGAQCPQHFETKLKQVEKLKLKLKLKKSKDTYTFNVLLMITVGLSFFKEGSFGAENDNWSIPI
jgi:hypothetical protein